jgi:hypothetical protein
VKNKFPREFYIPKGALKVADKQSTAVAYLSSTARGASAQVRCASPGKPISRPITTPSKTADGARSS